MTILVTGGAGYIGSHVCVELLQAGSDVVVIDNLSNSSAEVLSRVERITGRSVNFVEGDINDPELLAGIFRQHALTAVIHFAGLKAVGESVSQPLRYYYNNVCGTQCLLQAMDDAGVRRMVFSSSATVYGEPASNPITETFPLQATNPYGRSKLHIEEMLRDLAVSDDGWNIAILRYFNPVGAHESGLIGEDPSDIPNNLMPYVAQVAAGTLEQLQVFGNDYPTLDGTGVRDYIHVVDLALGHMSALEKLATNPGCVAYNLGTGQGYSVLELVAAFSKASGKDIPYRIVARRAGDIATCFANPAKAREELGWEAVRGVEQMCVDAWRWQSRD